MWGLKGVRLVRPVCPGYKNFYVYSAVSPTSGESFHLTLPWVNIRMMNLYLEKRSAAHADRDIRLVMDRAGWHVSKDLNIPKNIKLIFLPPYSPELNPVERLWQWLRRHACRNRAFTSLTAVLDAVSEQIKNLGRDTLASLCRCNYITY